MTPAEMNQLLDDMERIIDEQRAELGWVASSQPAGAAELDAARHHVRALLAILDEIGGYRTIEQQDAVRAAREWL